MKEQVVDYPAYEVDWRLAGFVNSQLSQEELDGHQLHK